MLRLKLWSGTYWAHSKPISEPPKYDLFRNTELRVVFPRWPSIGFKTVSSRTTSCWIQSYFSDQWYLSARLTIDIVIPILGTKFYSVFSRVETFFSRTANFRFRLEVNSTRFQPEIICFHVSHLPRQFSAWIFHYLTYECCWYTI